MVTEQVELNTFAPVETVHIGDWVIAGLLSFFLLSNAFRMYVLIMRRGAQVEIPLSLYITEAWSLVYHAVTQKRFSECDDNKQRWNNHLLLVSGYVLMFVMVVFFLDWFQTDEIHPIWHPQRWLGYYATIVLLYGAGSVILGRLKKEDTSLLPPK